MEEISKEKVKKKDKWEAYDIKKTTYRVGQKTGPQTHNHNSVKSYHIFSLQDSIVNLQLNGY